MKKWFKRLTDYCFGEYLKELRIIHMELLSIRSLLEAERKGLRGTLPVMPSLPSMEARLKNLQPLQPLTQGGTIFPSPQDRP